MKSDFILKKLSPITDVPIVEFMETSSSIDSIEYNNTFPIQLTIVIVSCFVIVASLLMYLLSLLKCANECSQYFTYCGERKTKSPTTEVIPMTPTTNTKL